MSTKKKREEKSKRGRGEKTLGSDQVEKMKLEQRLASMRRSTKKDEKKSESEEERRKKREERKEEKKKKTASKGRVLRFYPEHHRMQKTQCKKNEKKSSPTKSQNFENAKRPQTQ